MSTTYLTKKEMTLAEFNAIVGSDHEAQDMSELYCADGVTRVEFTRYGGSKVRDILELIECWSDEDYAFEALCFGDEIIDDVEE